jgi:hypothetical protein
MGLLANYNIIKLKDFYSLSHFVETGTFKGKSICDILSLGFISYSTVEIIPTWYEQAKTRFLLYPHVKCYLGDSVETLPLMLTSIPDNENCLFWLDAHLINDYNPEAQEVKNINDVSVFPLQSELQCILKNRDVTNDVFICDDARMYLNLPFDSPLPDNHVKCYGDIYDFILSKFSETHFVTIDFRFDGSFIMLPKKFFSNII